MALTKADMVGYLYEVMGLTKGQAKEFVYLFFEEIRLVLEQGHHVKLSGFGNFILKDKRQRPGRNPKTKEPVEITARRVVIFRSGGKLRDKFSE